MTVALARRLRGHHALLEMALKDERSRTMPDDRTLAGIKKKKLAIKDRLSVFDGASAQLTAQ
ncbi:MAG: YdcH family protein [Brevundimonas sp.]|uniref:YdcH family protein n=1 Tax=Brevundimonas sp. TaxID=1871086 RepID=UPI002ABB7F16|nr:YdcH family protein [Brevundimonas sp.]MDZ4110162.1 YdcH family protein [Brevundimonas sp.]